MKKVILFIVSVTGAFALGYFISGQRWHRHYGAEIQRLQQEWEQQAAVLENSRLQTRQGKVITERGSAASQTVPQATMATPKAGGAVAAPVQAGPSNPREILARIVELQKNGGPNSQRAVQRLLSDLVLAGPQSLAAIQEYLASGEDLKLDTQAKGKGAPGGKGGSLRQELLQVVMEIGGEQAEQVLAQTMRTAASPQEMLRLAQALEKMAPGKYQQAAVTAAHTQLANISQTKGDPGPYLEILGMYGDRSYVEQAQAALVQPDGRINKNALDYLQNVLHQDVLPVAQQLFQDGRLTDPKAREELARLATEYVGMADAANQMWYQSALNPELPDKTRERLIRELEKKGFQDPKNPTPQDVQLAQVRLQILDGLRAQMQASPQVTVVDETRLRLAVIVDPNLRQNLPANPKPNKIPR